MFSQRVRTLPRHCGLVLPLLAALICAVAPANGLGQGQGGEAPPAARVGRLNVVVLSTMLADTKGIGEWGFAALVEADGHRLLFDTWSPPRNRLEQCPELGIKLADVTDVVLSHHHGDHTGGLMHPRRELARRIPRRCCVYVVLGPLPQLFLADDGSESNEAVGFKEPYEATGGRFVEVGKPISLFECVWSTGPVPRTHPERNWSGRTKVKSAAAAVEDTIPEDMSLVLDTDRGRWSLRLRTRGGDQGTAGNTRKTVREAPALAALGGFHLFPADAATLDWTAGKLRDLRVGQIRRPTARGSRPSTSSASGSDSICGTRVVGAVAAGFDLIEGIRPGTIAR